MANKNWLTTFVGIGLGFLILSPIFIDPWTPLWPFAMLMIYVIALMVSAIIRHVCKLEPGTVGKRVVRVIILAAFSISLYLFIGILGARGSYPGTWVSNVLRWNGAFDYLESDGMRLEKLGV